MRLKEKLGIFYYFYFGLLFLVIGSLISFLGELKLGDFLCNFLRIIGFIVALFGGYYFLKFFILDAEKWFPFIPLIIKGVILLVLGRGLWFLMEKEIFSVFRLFYVIAGVILLTGGLYQISYSLILRKMSPLFLSANILSSLAERLLKKPLSKFKDKPFFVLLLALFVFIVILAISLLIFHFLLKISEK